MAWKERRRKVEELAMVLVKIKAAQFGTFSLSSGKLSSYYVDLRTVPSYPGTYRTVIDAYLELIKHDVGIEKFDAIAGIPTAGLAFSSPTALELQKPMIYARKEEKEYGRQKRIEGTIVPGWTVLVMDDLITTGGSIISAIDAIREEGCEVKDAVVLIDRLEGGRTNLKKIGVTLHSLTDILEIADTLCSKQMIADDEMKAIARQVGKRSQ
jgi:orotate phosphoribosyltransferase